MKGIVSVLWPLLLHMVTSEITAVLLQGKMDATAITAVTSVIVIPIAAWMYRCDCRKKYKAESGKVTVHSGVPFGLFCFVSGGILNLVWSGILDLFHIQEVFSNETQETLLASRILIQIIGLGVLVPLAEELVFRALIYTRMKRFMTVKQAVFFSALLFAVYHGNPIQMIFAFPMALALAAAFEHGKLFVFPLLFHMGANLTAVFLNFFI